MAAKGIIQGVGNNNFAPQSTLTRAQFATMIVNAFKLQNTTVENVFTDVKDNRPVLQRSSLRLCFRY
jgi:hypothetical protein